MDKLYKKKFSADEKLYLAGADIFPPFAIQMIIKGIGTICEKDFNEAILKTNFHPLIRTTTTLTPADFEKTFQLDSPSGSENFLEIVIAKTSEEVTLLFRASHCFTDAGGVARMVEQLFALLRSDTSHVSGDSAQQSQNLKKLKYDRKEPTTIHCKGLGKMTSQDTFQNEFLTLSGCYPNLIARLAVAIRKQLCQDKNDTCRIMIPVDIREDHIHEKSEIMMSNQSLPLFLNVKAEDDMNSFYCHLLQELDQKNYLTRSKKEFFYHILPKRVLKWGLKTLWNYQKKKNRYFSSALISHIGSFKKEIFSCPQFMAQEIFFLPISNPLAPITAIITENELKTHIAFSILSPTSAQEVVTNLIQLADLPLPINIDINDKITFYAKTKPNQMAIYDNQGKSLTYKEFASAIEFEAKTLLRQGAERVAIREERSLEAIIKIMATLKVGAAFVPIDPRYPQERIDYILKDSQCESHKKNGEKKSEKKSDLAYIIYTSGTTGRPKGVAVTRENLGNYLSWAYQTYVTQDVIQDVTHHYFALYTSLSFDLSITMLFLPFITGQTLKVGKEFSALQEKSPIMMMEDLINDPKITITKLTPSHLKIILGLQIKPKGKWRTLIVGGENFSRSLAHSIQSLFGDDLKIFNEYGPTETTVGCTAHLFKADDEHQEDNVPIGLAGRGMSVSLLEPDGEIVIGGLGVAKGYWKQEELTKKSFIDGEYRTGDLGLISNSVLHCLGRKDEQLKINGYRIELGEIIAHLETYPDRPGVERATILNDGSGLVAFYVTSNPNITPDLLKLYLTNKLPRHLVPHRYLRINEVPLTPHGKVNSEALLDLIPKNSNNKPELEQIWKKILVADSIKLLNLLHDIDHKLYQNKRFNEILSHLPAFLQAPTFDNFETMIGKRPS